MISSWQNEMIVFFRTISQILTAGIAITAFALLLYALTFNLRDRVARSFALILICVVIVFSSEAIGGTVITALAVDFWYRMQWVGIILLPAAYFHFSDALLETTGKPSRGRRRFAVRIIYLLSFVFLLCLPFEQFIGPIILDQQSTPQLKPTSLSIIFIIFYLLIMGLSWINFSRAYRRTTTPTSQRRMVYLILGSLAPALGSFPFLMFGSTFAAANPLVFWTAVVISNMVVGLLIILMAYSTAFFGVSWPDRVVKRRLVKWIMRGPATASVTLALTTIVNRVGNTFGITYSGLVPITMVGTILLCEFLITLFSPLWEKLIFYGKDKINLNLLHTLEDRLFTHNDLHQFMEMILSAICDRLQAPGAYVAVIDPAGLELVVTIGKTSFNNTAVTDELLQMVSKNNTLPIMFQWGEDYLVPLLSNGSEEEKGLFGLIGISSVSNKNFDDEQVQALKFLVERASLALQDRKMQKQVFQSLQNLTPEMDLIQQMRAAGRYDGSTLLMGEIPMSQGDVAHWVKDALSHYWGGPKLTESPLMQLKIVRDALIAHNGNYANSLRAILREAVEQVRPEGERRFTAEWILYNILEMKFLEGRKVRDIAMRLAMSEADLYRKQRIAIAAVAKAIMEKEVQVKNNVSD